jgi:hypothetical protein
MTGLARLERGHGRTRAQRLVSPLELLARSVLLSLGVDALVVVNVILLQVVRRGWGSV